jgi:hypothetical protein
MGTSSAKPLGSLECPACHRPNYADRATCYACGTQLVGDPARGIFPGTVTVSARPGAYSQSPEVVSTGRGPVAGPLGQQRRRLRRGPFVAGVVLVVIGVLILAGGYLLNAGTRTQEVPAGSDWDLTPNTLNSIAVSMGWSGGNSTTQAFIVTGTPTCTSPSGVVAQGSGPSGSASVTLQPGTTYHLYACSGSSYQTITFSYSATGGITVLELIGIVIVVVGGLLVLVGVRGRR